MKNKELTKVTTLTIIYIYTYREKASSMGMRFFSHVKFTLFKSSTFKPFIGYKKVLIIFRCMKGRMHLWGTGVPPRRKDLWTKTYTRKDALLLMLLW